MSRQGTLLIYFGYGLLAFLAVYCGLFVFRSLIVTFVLFHLLVCFGIPIFHGIWEGRLKTNLRDLGVSRPELLKDSLVAGIGSGAVLMFGVIAGFYLILQAGVDPNWIRLVLIQWGLTRNWFWIFVMYMIIGNSFMEELMWRGFLLERLQRIVSLTGARAISSFFYASYHVLVGVVLFGWKWGFIVALLAWVLGMFWSLLVGRYASLLSSWLSHMMVDVGIMISLIHWIMDGG
ncbi:CPBP family intramembrane glutamic endopeptidase [Brevibacillus ginsengisoli]|uniref:CPBP family intramembrane glutamic endopeptidase n=1 Tax=Brevibacillus ginsengisoli TaxID=363854 RepID=UPI003CFB93CE